MQDISWHNTDGAQPAFDIGNAQQFPGLLGGIVINATWSQMQPATGGAVDFSAVDAALAQITTYNGANASAPLGVKLRIYGGSNAPAWAKSIGGPVTIYRNPAGCNGQTDSCPLTVGAFWSTPYITAWRTFQAAVAAKYDTNPLIIAVAVTSCAAQTDEPFVASSGPVSKANLGRRRIHRHSGAELPHERNRRLSSVGQHRYRLHVQFVQQVHRRPRFIVYAERDERVPQPSRAALRAR